MTGGIIGLDIGLIRGIAEDLAIERAEDFYLRLSIFEDEIMGFIRGADSICDEKQKRRCQVEFGEYFDWACGNCEKKK